ncbi:Uma2 family endonuclease [Sphingomonas sp. PB4P5]|uniref:Uma2 family endonuclease n=1 Tax=Parasphingomonas puruogangriensis TaxID=3096155 RepID=UPI002FC7B3FF
MAQQAGARFTTAEFLRMYEAGAFDDMNVELVEGELQRMNRPMSSHGWRQSRLSALLWAAVAETTLQVFSDTGIDLGRDTVRGFDVGIVLALPDTNRLLRAEEIVLAIEIAESSIVRDLGPKRNDYAAADIPNYWVVDGDRSVVHVFADPIGGQYAAAHTVRFGDPLAVPGTNQIIVIV